jgi:hypothetical protein
MPSVFAGSAALDETVHEGPADACRAHQVIHRSPVFSWGRAIRRPRFAVHLEILGPDSARVLKPAVLELPALVIAHWEVTRPGDPDHLTR